MARVRLDGEVEVRVMGEDKRRMYQAWHPSTFRPSMQLPPFQRTEPLPPFSSLCLPSERCIEAADG